MRASAPSGLWAPTLSRRTTLPGFSFGTSRWVTNASKAPCVLAGHPDLGPRVVDEDEISSFQGARPGSKTVAKRLDAGRPLFGGDDSLFFRERPSRASSLLIVDVLKVSFARSTIRRTNSGIVASGRSEEHTS